MEIAKDVQNSASLDGEKADNSLVDEHDQTWLFIVAAVIGLMMEVIWCCRDGRRARIAEHFYATVGTICFAIGLFGLVFKIVDFSDSIAFTAIGLGLFGVVDSLSISRRDAIVRDQILDEKFKRIESLIERNIRLNVATQAIDAVLRLMKT